MLFVILTLCFKAFVCSPSTCGICLEDIQPLQIAACPPCSHFYHEECIRQWFTRQNSCPMCRKPLPVVISRQSQKRKIVTIIIQVFFNAAFSGIPFLIAPEFTISIFRSNQVHGITAFWIFSMFVVNFTIVLMLRNWQVVMPGIT